jgi:hypothetical protein
MKIFNDTDGYFPKPYPGRKSTLTPQKWDKIVTFVTNNPDRTLEEIIEELVLPIHKSRFAEYIKA